MNFLGPLDKRTETWLTRFVKLDFPVFFIHFFRQAERSDGVTRHNASNLT